MNENVIELPQPEWPTPEPLRRKLPPADVFPVEALGEILAPAALKVAEAVQAPIGICGQSILAGAALAVQGFADVVIDGRIMPISEFFISIGESGERKSAVDKLVLKPHRDHQYALNKDYECDYKKWLNDQAAYDVTKREILSSKRNRTLMDKKQGLESIGSEPIQPLKQIFIVEEPTFEGLLKLMLINQPSVGIFTDEGARFVGSHSMNDENVLRMIAGLSSLWDGQPISRVRAGDGASIIEGRRLSLHLMIQPTIINLMLSSNLLKDQGFLSRCLITWPDSTVGTRFYKCIDVTNSAEFNQYVEKMKLLLSIKLPIARDKRNELIPRQLSISYDAKQLWIAFHDAVEQELSEDGQLVPVKGLANKSPEHAVRIAGIIALVEDVEALEIKAAHMLCGIKLTQHYLNEALRLTLAGATDPILLSAEKLLNWLISKKDKIITLVEIYQYGPSEVRDAGHARALMLLLEEHGWVKAKLGGALFQGKLRKEAWEIRS